MGGAGKHPTPGFAKEYFTTHRENFLSAVLTRTVRKFLPRRPPVLIIPVVIAGKTNYRKSKDE